MGRRLRVALGAAVGIGAALLVAVVSALAGTPTAISHSEVISTNQQSLVEAKCPSGEAPVSGGFRLDPSTSAFMTNSAEGVDLTMKKWSLTSQSQGGSGLSTAFAYCSALARNLKFRSSSTTLAFNQSKTLTASCHPDERALSGGYAFVSSSPTVALETKSILKGTRKWTVRAFNITNDDPATFLVFAHCLPKDHVPDLLKVRDAVPYPDDGRPTATAKCPHDRYALSGGFFARGNNAFEAPLESRRLGSRSWTATIASQGQPGDKFTAVAYCAKK